jgi:hypothetical protein
LRSPSLATDALHFVKRIYVPSCPSCLQGLQRYKDDVEQLDTDYVVEIAKHVLGENWLREYVEKAGQGGSSGFWCSAA